MRHDSRVGSMYLPIRMGGERSELVEKRVAMCEDIFCMTVLRWIFWKWEFLFQSHFPFLRAQFNFFTSKSHMRNGIWAFKILISNFSFPISDSLVLISHFRFPISEFPFLTSHFSFPIAHIPLFFQVSSYYIFPCHHFLILIIHVWLKYFLTKTVIKHLWIIWTLISQLLTWSEKQEMGNGKREIGSEKWETVNEKWEMRNGKSGIGKLELEKYWIGPWEVGNGIQIRIPIFKISSSVL